GFVNGGLPVRRAQYCTPLALHPGWDGERQIFGSAPCRDTGSEGREQAAAEQEGAAIAGLAHRQCSRSEREGANAKPTNPAAGLLKPSASRPLAGVLSREYVVTSMHPTDSQGRSMDYPGTRLGCCRKLSRSAWQASHLSVGKFFSPTEDGMESKRLQSISGG